MVRDNFDDARMAELLADFLFATKSVRENRVGFHFSMGKLDGNLLIGMQIGGAENRRGGAACDHGVDPIMVQLFDGTDVLVYHYRRRSSAFFII
jgi:hypothetical protein